MPVVSYGIFVEFVASNLKPPMVGTCFKIAVFLMNIFYIF